MSKKLAILDRCIGKWDDVGGVHTYLVDYLIPLLYGKVDIVYCYPSEKLKSKKIISEIKTDYPDIEVRYVGNYDISDWSDIDVVFAPDSFTAFDKEINNKMYDLLTFTQCKLVYAFQTNPKSLSLNRTLDYHKHLSTHPNSVACIYYGQFYEKDFNDIYLRKFNDLVTVDKLKFYLHQPYVGYMNTPDRHPHKLGDHDPINIGYTGRTSSVKGYKDFLDTIIGLSDDDLDNIGMIYYASNLDSMGMWDKKYYQESRERMSPRLKDKFVEMNYDHDNIYDVLNHIDVGFVPTRFSKIYYPGEWTAQELIAAGVIPAYNNLDHDTLDENLQVLTDYDFNSVLRHRDLELTKVINYPTTKIIEDKMKLEVAAHNLMDKDRVSNVLMAQLQLV